ncbi:MAG: hypothetical protein ABI592_01185 [Acidobacteriota bacterium]
MNLARVTIPCGCGEILRAAFKVQVLAVAGPHHGVPCPRCFHWHGLPDAVFELLHWTPEGWSPISAGWAASGP